MTLFNVIIKTKHIILKPINHSCAEIIYSTFDKSITQFIGPKPCEEEYSVYRKTNKYGK